MDRSTKILIVTFAVAGAAVQSFLSLLLFTDIASVSFVEKIIPYVDVLWLIAFFIMLFFFIYPARQKIRIFAVFAAALLFSLLQNMVAFVQPLELGGALMGVFQLLSICLLVVGARRLMRV